MKHNFLTYIFLCVLLLCTASCKDELLYGGGIIGEGESVISGTVKFKPLMPALNGSTRTPGDAIKDINSLCVLLYDVEGKLVKKYPLIEAKAGSIPKEGEYVLSEEERTDHKTESIGGENKDLPPAESKTPHADFKLTVPFGYYYIYAVANMDDLSEYEEAIKTKEGLKSISLKWNVANIAANKQMFGFFSEASTEADAPLLTINKGGMVLHAWIRRAASKITIAYDGSKLEEGIFVYLKSVTIRDIPSVCLLGDTNIIQKVEDLVTVGESIDYAKGATEYNEFWKARITKGKPYYYSGCEVALTKDEYEKKGGKKAAHAEDLTSLFFYENMQGNGKDKRQDKEGDGVLDAPGFEDDETYSLKDDKPYGTYIEVEGYYHSIHPERPGSGKIKFRFMLGKDVETDYNAERNHHYKLTLVFNRFANDADWHIEYKEEVPSIQAPVPYYISYLYNHSATMPVKVNVREGYRLKSFEAKIDSNAWASYKPDPALEYFKQMDPDATPTAQKNVWNGFLSLRKTKMTVIEETDNSGKKWTNQTYYEEHQRGSRVYYKDGELNTVDNIATDGTYTMKYDQDKNVYIFNLPIYTRAKQMIPVTGYTGNNPYVAYQRKAVIKFTAVMEKVGDPNDTETVEGKSTVIQVRRVVNPKGVWREYNSTTPFHVVLKRLPKESSDSFETFTSEGAWKAYVVRGPKNFVTLDGGSDTIKGSTGTPIDFTIGFNGEIKETESRCAIVRVEYHNYSCVHLIFVRQGKAPMALISNGRKWHACNMRTQNKEGQCPLDEGSLFRFGNWKEPLDAVNNSFNNFNSEGWKEYVIAGDINNKKKWIDIAADTYQGNFESGTVDGKTVVVASLQDYEVLWNNDDIEQAYGVLYGNEATETLSKTEEVYGYIYSKHQKKGDTGAGYGMRGTFVYNTSEDDTYGGRNLFFPIGVAGHGHRKHRDRKDSWESAVLRYAAGRTEAMPASEAKDRPLLFDLYRRPGAIYWLDKNANLTRNGTVYKDVIAWDFNYFTLDFNYMPANNVFKKELGEPDEPDAKSRTNHSDACFIRCVEDP